MCLSALLYGMEVKALTGKEVQQLETAQLKILRGAKGGGHRAQRERGGEGEPGMANSQGGDHKQVELELRKRRLIWLRAALRNEV